MGSSDDGRSGRSSGCPARLITHSSSGRSRSYRRPLGVITSLSPSRALTLPATPITRPSLTIARAQSTTADRSSSLTRPADPPVPDPAAPVPPAADPAAPVPPAAHPPAAALLIPP